MADWKDEIRLTIKDKNDAKTAEETKRQTELVAADRRVAEKEKFLKDVVRPALDEIKTELGSHGLQGSVSQTPQDVGIDVVEHGKNRFSYRISGGGDACIRAFGGSASIGLVPFQGPSCTGEDIKRHFALEFRSLFNRKG
jgi:hypothetical protein